MRVHFSRGNCGLCFRYLFFCFLIYFAVAKAVFQLACRVIEALGMNVSDFYHGEYVLGEEIVNSKEGLRYKKTGKLIEEDVSDL